VRWNNEFVRHKVLDLFGDLALVGMPVQGHVRVERGGHSLHQKLVAAILANPQAWEIVEAGKRGARGISLSRIAAAARF
jgi:UDP-3-O-[3-hydroxymyristoyl] N-acetylglucosamine deacetylase